MRRRGKVCRTGQGRSRFWILGGLGGIVSAVLGLLYWNSASEGIIGLLPTLPASGADTREPPHGKSLTVRETWSGTGKTGDKLSREGREE